MGWKYRSEGELLVQYNPDLDCFGWDKLKEIAAAAKATGSIWDAPGERKAEINTHKGVQYIAFMMTNPFGKLSAIIETRERFETVMKINLTDLVPPVQDGQHRHGK